MTDNTAIPQNTPGALVRAEGADDGSIQGRWDYSTALSKAGDVIPKALWAPVRNQDGTMGPPAPSAGKIMAVTEVARMLGFHPLAGIMGVHIIEGRPTMSAEIMAAKIRTSGHRLRIGTRGSVGDLSLVGWAVLIRKDDPDFEYRVEWDLHDAIAAGLGSLEHGKWTSKKDNWRKYPRAMLKARAIAEVCREAAQDEMLGAAYLPDELGANTNESGEPIDVPAPTRDWAADIDALKTVEHAAILREELRVSPDYTADLWGRLLARYGAMTAGPQEDVYESDGRSAAPEGQNQGQDAPAPAPGDDVPSEAAEPVEGRTEPQPDDDVVVAEVMPDEPTSDEERDATEEAAFDQHYADMAYDPELENLDPQMVREYGVEAARAAAALHAKAQQKTARPGFNSSAMGGTK